MGRGLWLVGIIALVEAINFMLGRALNGFGIIPRHTESLPGILAAPFLHVNFAHFLSNLVPLAIFAVLLVHHGWRRYWSVTLFVIVVGGAFVWVFGRTAVHIGASGLVYGWFGYLALSGLLSKQLKLILISLFVVFAYSGILWGVVPSRGFVSWEAHLGGLLAGAFLAWQWRHTATRPARVSR